MEPLELRQLPVGQVVVVQQAVPVDLRPERSGAPPEEADVIRAVGNALHGPKHHLPGLGGRRVGPDAAARSRLLLHNPKVGAHRPHLHQAAAPLPVQQGGVVPGVLPHGKGEVGIAVVSVHVQAVPGHPVVVQAAEHAVGGDEIPGLYILPENFALHPAEPDGALRDEPHVVQLLVGIGAVPVGGAGHIDLLPGGVGLVPEGIAPGPVQLLQGAVFIPQEFPEGQGVALRVELLGLAVELVVDLPAHNAGPLSVVLPQLLHHPGGKLLVLFGIVVVVAAHAVAVQNPVPAGVEHLRVLVCQPGRGRGGGRAEDHLHARLLRQIQEPVPEGEGKHSLLRLCKVPGEFPHADGGNPVGQHPSQVLFPQGAVPVLGVVAGPQLQLFPGGFPIAFHTVFLPTMGPLRPVLPPYLSRLSPRMQWLSPTLPKRFLTFRHFLLVSVGNFWYTYLL